jgi:hypothetical protein
MFLLWARKENAARLAVIVIPLNNKLAGSGVLASQGCRCSGLT